MPDRNLADYFQSGQQERALAAYSRFATSTAWSVPNKMDLYRESRVAYGEDAAEVERVAAFDAIYSTLNSHWQVFRPHGADECWPAKRIFETIQREFTQSSWPGGITLPIFLSSGYYRDLVPSLTMMESIKPNAGFPVMTVSKFLHFYNPGLFPIFDTEVVQNRVFRRFRNDYRAFCKESGLDSKAGRPAFYQSYVAWASSLVSSAGPEFMPIFAGMAPR